MSRSRYLPAIRTKAHSLRLGRLSIRTSDDRELGKLLGFVLDAPGGHISSLVMEVVDAAGTQQVELPMVPLRLDAACHALRLVESDAPCLTVFDADSAAQVEEDDLWVPIVQPAA
jgi:hypothetical protein